jgi:hypothetical protein
MPQPTDADLAALRRMVGRMIPASEKHGAPGADDARIFADIVETLRASPAGLDAVLAGVGEAAAPPPALTLAVAQCYYRDDRVMRSLGMEPRPPFPKGYEAEEGDWSSLLAPVRGKPRIWRDER